MTADLFTDVHKAEVWLAVAETLLEPEDSREARRAYALEKAKVLALLAIAKVLTEQEQQS